MRGIAPYAVRFCTATIDRLDTTQMLTFFFYVARVLVTAVALACIPRLWNSVTLAPGISTLLGVSILIALFSFLLNTPARGLKFGAKPGGRYYLAFLSSGLSGPISLCLVTYFSSRSIRMDFAVGTVLAGFALDILFWGIVLAGALFFEEASKEGRMPV